MLLPKAGSRECRQEASVTANMDLRFWKLRGPAWMLLLTLWVLSSLLPGRLALAGQDLPLPENPLKGRFVFEQKGCGTCHVSDGKEGPFGPDLAQNEFYGTYMELASVMWNHSPLMLRRMQELNLPYPRFSENEMKALIAYLYFQRYLGVPGDLYRGKFLVESKGCLTCHSIGGRGGGLGPAFDELAKYVSPLYMAQALWNHGPSMDKEISKRGIERPKFNEGELDDLSAYIRVASRAKEVEQVYMAPGNPRRGALVLEKKGCLSCHSVQGKGASIAADFTSIKWNKSVTEIAGLMWNHSAEMNRLMIANKIEWPQFSGREMADLIAYLYFLGFQDEPGDPANGERLFSEKQCAQCHGTTEEGTEAFPGLVSIRRKASVADIGTLMWNHAPAMERKVTEKIVDWPRLTGKEMADLHAFLQQEQEASEAK